MMRSLMFSLLITSSVAFSQSNSIYRPVSYTDTLKLTGKDSAAILLDEALSLMKRNYYEKNQIGWDSLVREAKRKLCAVNNCQDSYSILSNCFKLMDAGHSFIMPPSNTALY
jgi:hypothetical protein